MICIKQVCNACKGFVDVESRVKHPHPSQKAGLTPPECTTCKIRYYQPGGRLELRNDGVYEVWYVKDSITYAAPSRDPRRAVSIAEAIQAQRKVWR